MDSNNKRKDERRLFKTRITHSMYNLRDHRKHHPTGYHDNHHEGLMGNISREGMYFETDTPCRKGSTIFINLPDEFQGISMVDVTEPLTGIVVWCMKNDLEDHPEYKVGVRFDT